MFNSTIKERLNKYNIPSVFRNLPLFIRENFSIFFTIIVGFIGWYFEIYDYTFMFLGLFFAIILIFNFNVKNIFPGFFIIPSCIGSPYHYFAYAVGLGLTFLGLILYTIRHCLINKEQVTKGKLFWGFVALTLCFAFGGAIGHLNIKYNLLVTGLCLAGYFVYFLAINFCTNFKTFFRNIIIGIATLLVVQFFVCHLKIGLNILDSISNKVVLEIGTQNINNVAIYFSLAMVMFFQIAYKNKRDYLYCLVAIFFGIMTFLTYCRMGTFVAFLIALAAIIIVYIKSQNKKVFNICFVALGIAVVIIMLLSFVFKVINIFDWYVSLDFFNGNGREVMFPWAWEQFKQNPIFGIGYYIAEGLPIDPYVKKVTVDNTILQYLLSTGSWGTLFATVFYVFKYKTIFTNFSQKTIFILLSVLLIALNGITSQAPTTDVFFVELSILFVAVAEIESREVKTSNLKPSFKLAKN